jgi:acetyltransferase-like isoleucine patch superfamily enzyme
MKKLNLVNGAKIHETAEIDETCEIGKGTIIWKNVQVREGAKIGENCIMGKDVYIDLEVSIGDRVKVQNGVSVYNGVTLEDDVFLGPYMVLTNDLYPRAYDKEWKVVPTLIKKGASVGANATIVCGVTIGKYAMIGAGTVVNKNVPNYGLLVGNPARLIGFVCECGRKMEEKEVGNEFIKMYCSKCNKATDIKIDDYNLIVKK